MSSLTPGNAVVVIGQGAGNIVSADGDKVVVHLREGDVAVKLEDAGHLLRAVVAREEAEQHLRRLCERCNEERTLAALRSIRELTRAALPDQIEYLRWYFRKRKALYGREDEMIQAAADPVLEELALSLGVDALDLRAAVKRGKASVERRAKPVLPPAPALERCTFLRSFWLGARAVIGERPESDEDTKTISVKAGAWHAYVTSEDAAGIAEGVLLRYAEIESETLVAPAIELGNVNVEGGTIGILDKAALTDDAFGVDEVERTRAASEGYGDRGVEVSTGGDGAHAIFADTKKDATTVFVPF